MRILITGAGPIGLALAGTLTSVADVTLLTRSKRLDSLSQGFTVHDRGLTTQARPKVIDRIRGGEWDIVVAPVQSTSIAALAPDLRVAAPTVALISNTVSDYPTWRREFGDRLLTAFPAFSARLADGGVQITRLEGILRRLQTTVVGTAAPGAPSGEAKQFAAVLSRAGHNAEFQPNMQAWQATHSVWVFALAQAIWEAAGDRAVLASNKDLLVDAVEVIREGFAVLRMAGEPVTPGKLRILGGPPRLLVPILQHALRAPVMEELAVHHAMNSRSEMLRLGHQLLDLARSLGVPVPTLSRQLKVVTDPENSACSRCRR